MEDNIFSFPLEVQEKLRGSLLSGTDLKRYLLFSFGTYNKAAQIAGIDESRIHQLAAGYKVPSNPDIIKRLSQVWKIDLVILTQLFDRLRQEVIR